MLKIMTIALAALFTASANEPEEKHTIYTIGDSTMAQKAPEKRPETGWAECIAKHLKKNSGFEVNNCALNGRSTKSFITENRWKAILENLKPGDYVFIQFGHNDNKPNDSLRYTNASTLYKENLKLFINDTRAKGAVPILFTSIVRRNFNENGVLIDTHCGYPDAMRQVAAETNTTLVDAQLITEKLVIGYGPQASTKLYLHLEPGQEANYPEGKTDNTHLCTFGANKISDLLIAELKNKNEVMNRIFE